MSHRAIGSVVTVLFGAFLIFVPLARAAAEPQYRVEASSKDSIADRPPASVTPQSAAVHFEYRDPNDPANYRLEDAVAFAGRGRLGVYARATSYYPNAASVASILPLHNASAEASFTIDDVMIVLESDPGFVGSIDASYNLHVEGSLSANVVAINGSGGYSQAGAHLEVNSYALGGAQQLGGSFDRITTFDPVTATGGTFDSGTGVLVAGFDGDETYTSVIQTLPVGTPFQFTLRLTVGAHAYPRRSGAAGATEIRIADGSGGFLNTVSFGETVFNLPPGYLAYSTDGEIVDNHFDVPEPAADVALGAGFASILAWGRRRRGRSPSKSIRDRSPSPARPGSSGDANDRGRGGSGSPSSA